MTITRTITTLKYSIIAVIISIGALFAASAIPIAGNYRVYAVVSNSMAPTIRVGSIVVVVPQDAYTVGDVVTVKSGQPQRPITHRIVARDERGRFITKGDANATRDIVARKVDDVIGVVRWHVPIIGYPIAWVQTPQGFVTLIVIPAALITYHEILAIVAMVESRVRQRTRKERKQKAQ